MTGETSFQRYIPEPHTEELVAPSEIRRHILCTGQVYQTLLAEREAKGIKDVAISRVEQISPFPYDLVSCVIYRSRAGSLTIYLDHPSSRHLPECGSSVVPGLSPCCIPSRSRCLTVSTGGASQQRCLVLCWSPYLHRREQDRASQGQVPLLRRS